jgi:hypothetical protein
MPNCTEETGTRKIEFGRLGRRIVEGQFDGASMTSDAGVMLLGATDRKLGLMQAAARCAASRRDVSSMATTTATATAICRYTCCAANNCCAPTCAPAALMGPNTPPPF